MAWTKMSCTQHTSMSHNMIAVARLSIGGSKSLGEMELLQLWRFFLVSELTYRGIYGKIGEEPGLADKQFLCGSSTSEEEEDKDKLSSNLNWTQTSINKILWWSDGTIPKMTAHPQVLNLIMALLLANCNCSSDGSSSSSSSNGSKDGGLQN